MKKLVVMFGVLMIISRVAFAGGVNTPKATSTSVSMKGEIVKIFYRSENSNKSDKVKVTIYDASSKAVFTEEIKRKSTFIRPYNLENLPYGEYTIVLEDKNGRTEEKVMFAKESVDVRASIIHKKESRKAMVTVFSSGETEVTYSVLDINNNVLYSKSEKVNGQAAKYFNLEKVKGAVTVQVSDSQGLLKYKTL
jgi:flagellar hook assembly protein FlgD